MTTCQDEPLLQGYSYTGLSLSLPGNIIEEGTKSVVLPESKEGSFRPLSRASAPSLGPVPSDPGLREEKQGPPHGSLPQVRLGGLAGVPGSVGPGVHFVVRGRYSCVKASHILLGRGGEGLCPDPVREACPGHRGPPEDL